jgi:hypothetical protein
MLFDFAITTLNFQSEHFTVTGTIGGLAGVTIPGPGQLLMQTSVVINGQPVQLVGSGPLSLFSNDTIGGLQISGQGYALTIVANAQPE